MQKLLVGLASCLLVSLTFFLLQLFGFLSVFKVNTLAVVTSPPSVMDKQAKQFRIKKPMLLFGIAVDSFQVINETIKTGQSLSQILQNYNISNVQIDELKQKSKQIFNLRRIQAHKSYTLLCDKDSMQTARYFIYQPNATEYIVFHLQDSLHIYKAEKQIQTVERVIGGTIQSSLYEAMADAGCSPGLINLFADIYSWKVNFAAIQPGDQFKLIFEEHLLEGEPIGYGAVKAALFEHEGKSIYAIHYGEGEQAGYYDQDGKSMKKAFLKEPLEYTRISSRFSMKRFHPVQKRYKAHLGTDFAAPYGTPIRSVGEGIILEAGFAKGNGNYVKIMHDKTYTTQYLHMSRFAKGIKRGARVSMGQMIGYVGSTGLASGPHLCYRFWKNGKQVDALREKLPESKPVDKQEVAQFEQLSQGLITQLSEGETTEVVVKNDTAFIQRSAIHSTL